jgi:hypothetical protein
MSSKRKIEINDDEIEVASSRPIILIGRGGGGTRLLSEMVLSLGFFMGNQLNASFDSKEWVDKIYELAIENILYPFENQSTRDLYWCREIRSQAFSILKTGNRKPSDPWGWKLPETTLIVQKIMQYFPQARFVHLIRHPVTSCCRRTHMTSRLGNRIGAAALPAAYEHIGRSAEQIQSDPVHVHNAASWVYQVDSALNALDEIVDSNCKHLIKFESLCNETANTMEDLKQFLDVKATMARQQIDIDIDRLKLGSQNKNDAAEVWNICGNLATKLGYQWA